MTTGESNKIPRPSNLKYIKEKRLREETRIIVNIPILGADDSFLGEDNNNQIIKDAPWRLIVGYEYPNLNEYKVKLQQQFNEAWFAGAGINISGSIVGLIKTPQMILQ